jgi:hypothetical protein
MELLKLTPANTTNVIRCITQSLREKKDGCIFIRFGDGEYFTLFFEKQQKPHRFFVEKRVLGMKLTNARLNFIRDKMLQVLSRSEYIGICDSEPLMKPWHISLGERFRDRIEFGWHLELAKTDVVVGAFKQWFEVAEQIGLITCRTGVVKTLRESFPDKNIIHYAIPSEARYASMFPESSDKKYKDKRLERLEEVCAELRKTVVPKSLWLVGAGVLKFFYADVIQSKGEDLRGYWKRFPFFGW